MNIAILLLKPILSRKRNTGNALTTKGLETLFIALEKNQVTDVEINSCVFSVYMTDQKYMSSHNFFSPLTTGIQCGDDGACVIARHITKTRVAKLDISGLGITTAGFSALAPVLAASAMRELDISENEVGSAGIVEFCRVMSGNSTLQVLTATGLFHKNKRMSFSTHVLDRMRDG